METRTISVISIILIMEACSEPSESHCSVVISHPIDGDVVSSDLMNIFLEVQEPEGDEEWSFFSPTITDLEDRATIYKSGNTTIFRWSPMPDLSGRHDIVFTVESPSCGTDSATITVDLSITSVPAPNFVLPSLRESYDISTEPCLEIAIEVEDEDSNYVAIRQVPPLIEGGQLSQFEGHKATWSWCPTTEQIRESLFYTLIVGADDFENEEVMFSHAIELLP